jgi:hypothetical protein
VPACQVVRDHAARAIDIVLAADHDQIVSRSDAHGLRESWVAVQD